MNYVFPNFQPTFKLLKVVEFNSSNASVCEQNEIYLHIFRSYGHRLKFLSSTLAPHIHETQEGEKERTGISLTCDRSIVTRPWLLLDGADNLSRPI